MLDVVSTPDNQERFFEPVPEAPNPEIKPSENIEHDLKVAERGNFYTVNGIEFSIDKIRPTLNGGVASKCIQSLKNVILPETWINEQLILMSIGIEFLNLLENKPDFKRDIILLLYSVTGNNSAVHSLSNDDLLLLAKGLIIADSNYFLEQIRKIRKVAEALRS